MSLSLEALSLGYGRRTVVDDITLLLPSGKVGRIDGPNGSGKSTLLAGIAGLLPARSGLVRIGQTVVSGMPPWRISHVVGYMPQERSIIGPLSARDHVRLNRSFPCGHTVGEFGALFGEWIGGGWDAPAALLSTGEKTLLNLLLLLDRKLPAFVLDEPFAALSPRAARLAASLIEAAVSQGSSVLFAEHRSDLPLSLDFTWELPNNGRLTDPGEIT
jgi:ABC-type cobalamin/Fe3+-siderophores transport system ATPase subunit